MGLLALQEHSDDAMLAAYIQMMEQSKASPAGPTFHHHPTAQQTHYYYPQQ